MTEDEKKKTETNNKPTWSVVKNEGNLRFVEKNYRKYVDTEQVVLAQKTALSEVVNNVLPDKDGPWVNPLYLSISRHITTIGVADLTRSANRFLEEQKEEHPMDIISVTAGVEGNQISLYILIRPYPDKKTGKLSRIRISDFYEYIGEELNSSSNSRNKNKSKLLIPEGAFHEYTKKDYESHNERHLNQESLRKESTPDNPFLNKLETYIPQKLYKIDPSAPLTYDLKTKDMEIQLKMNYDDFIDIFQQSMRYITSSERDAYYSTLRNEKKKSNFFIPIKSYLQRTFIDPGLLPMEDEPALIAKIDRALFDLYLVQDLIDDPMITDVKITDPYSIRVRVKGKAYLSNVTFVDAEDYIRFINGLSVLNNIDLKVPSQTFTDEQDDNYILRFSITAPYITGNNFPIIHIRKIPRKKPMSEELIEAGMLTPVVRDYLIDQSLNHGKSIVFSGPPGSGKTTALNWFIEDGYEDSAEILVIQENDELFCYRRGVMLEHVVMNPQRGEQECSLESLGKMALVAGANVFVIGEAKGAEINAAITLSNSGCRTAITIHSRSSTDTIDKMADLAMRGEANISYEQAKRNLSSFDIVVYMEDYKIREIAEISGYNEETKTMNTEIVYSAPPRRAN